MENFDWFINISIEFITDFIEDFFFEKKIRESIYSFKIYFN